MEEIDDMEHVCDYGDEKKLKWFVIINVTILGINPFPKRLPCMRLKIRAKQKAITSTFLMLDQAVLLQHSSITTLPPLRPSRPLTRPHPSHSFTPFPRKRVTVKRLKMPLIPPMTPQIVTPCEHALATRIPARMDL